MANKIERQKGVVVGFGIFVLVVALASIIFAIVLLATMAGKEGLGLALHIAFGILLFLFGGFLVVVGIRIVWIGGSVKATHGSLAQENLAHEKNATTKVCPKCGCTNSAEATECTSCHTAL